MDDMRAQSAMQMIMHAGDARALAMQALDALNTFDVEGAREKLKEANKEVVEAHKIQTEAIVDETRGIPAEYSVLFCHAQDTLMTVNTEINLANHLVEMTAALDERIEKLENK